MMRSPSAGSLLLLTPACLVSGGHVPAAFTVPARRAADANAGEPGSYYCDGSHYCKDGGACCPDMVNGGFGCAGSDKWANCKLFEREYCPGDQPVICGGNCCTKDQMCRKGQCEAKLVSGAMAFDSVAQRGLFTREQGPPLAWYPSGWSDGMLRTIEENLHNGVFAKQAAEWRSNPGDTSTGQCWVVGFPADIAQCNKPYDDACKGSAAAIVQDGPMTFYNKNPVLQPTNYDSMDWCNDDATQTQTYSHDYSYKETQTFEVTVSETTKITVGMASKTTMEESLIFETGKEEIDLSFQMEVDVTATAAQTTTKEKQWAVHNTVSVGPRSHVYSTCWLSVGTLTSPFDAKVKINSPIVWACNAPEKDYNTWVYPTDKALWQSFNLEKLMSSHFGFTQEDISAIFSAPLGGTFKGIVGQKVECKTHTVPLKPGESCNGMRHSNDTIVV
eukprot:TRINITY_DN93062_c0_g1_i1.p1 TRINITY_DN93062_c0_g1~~TRINITY_DN93062_c0_g1_i1.p1  ORF type:complete len:445 (-),score=88.34 TRINITY_DN93062_c0_g1_i1:286-1620(-)